jgi:hypothetical protein
MSKNNEKDIKKKNENLQNYWKELESLESDFSDLEDLDLEELEDMKNAIELVKKREEEDLLDTSEEEIQRENEESPQSLDSYQNLEESSREQENELGKTFKADEIIYQDLEQESISKESQSFFEEKEELITDFSDIGKMDLDELLEMKEAVEMVKKENSSLSKPTSSDQDSSEMTSELERRLEEELAKKREKQKQKEIFTEDRLLSYFKEKRDKIWYHALYYLAFEVEDHIASKSLLYEMLKEVTSKSAIDPLPEHSFYFGLGYILRLTLEEKQVVRYMSGGKFRINVNIDKIKRILKEAGEPINTRPVIEEEKKKQMFRNFLDEDFTDI